MSNAFIANVFKYTFFQLQGLIEVIVVSLIIKYEFPVFAKNFGFTVIVLNWCLLTLLSFLLMCKHMSKIYGKQQKYLQYFSSGILVSFLYSISGISLVSFLFSLQSFILYNIKPINLNFDELIDLISLCSVFSMFLSIGFTIIFFFYEKYNSN